MSPPELSPAPRGPKTYFTTPHDALARRLTRQLAIAHALATPVPEGAPVAWWALLPHDQQDPGRRRALSLAELVGSYRLPAVREVLDAAHRQLGLAPLDHDAAQRALEAVVEDAGADAEAHLLDALRCAAFERAVEARFGPAVSGPPLDRDASVPSPQALQLLDALVGFDTGPRGQGHEACVAWLVTQLEQLGFRVETLGEELGRPLLVARRPARGLAGHLALYGHYDATPFGRPQRWTYDPRVLTHASGRLHARGVADNKGALACRLAAIGSIDASPALTWLIQGEEEVGSCVARALLPAVMTLLAADHPPTLWLDETGYHDRGDGTLRLLARRIGLDRGDAPIDAALAELLQGLRALASRWGVGARHERRGLNKAVVAGGCPFEQNLPAGARYLAVGVNDSAARIHGLNESIPAWTFPLHRDQLSVLFRWIDGVARSHR